MQHQEIVLGRSGQSFTYDPPDGRPAASPIPTLHVIGGVSATTGECSIDPVETVLVGDAHAGSKLIRVANPEGIVPGGRYLMTKPEGDREWIEVVANRDGDLALKHPLIHRYAGAATIVGCRISVGVDPAWSSKAANLTTGRHHGLAGYVLRWTYTFGDFEVTGVSFADLVNCESKHLVTPPDVDASSPGWIAGLPLEHRPSQGADFIAEAVRAVRLEAVGDAHAQRKIHDSQVMRELVRIRANVIRLEQAVMHGAPRGEELAIAEQRYRSSYARLVGMYRSHVRPAPEPDDPKPSAKGSDPGVRRRIPKLTNH
jgi:hypothetical protein